MRFLRCAASILIGLRLYFVVLQRPLGYAIVSKATGGNQPCPGPQLLKLPSSINRFADLQRTFSKQLTPKQEDPLGIEQFASPTWPSWIKEGALGQSALSLLAYV